MCVYCVRACVCVCVCVRARGDKHSPTYDSLISNDAGGTMNVSRALLTVLLVARPAESRCSPTSYYKNCWIRSFTGIVVDLEESQRQGARLLRTYREESALRCGRTCCLTSNAPSCNVAVFHLDATHDNCCHLHCPTLESCVISRSTESVLYNVTKGVDPDLLVFGKHLASNIRMGRVNASELLPLDKRQFFHPLPPVATIKPTASSTRKTTGRSSTVTPKPLRSSVSTFQMSIPTYLVPYRAPPAPTFLPTTVTTRPLTSSTSAGTVDTNVRSAQTSVKKQDYPNSQAWMKERDANYRSPKLLLQERGANHSSTQTLVKERESHHRSTRPSFTKRGTNEPSTQSAVKGRDANYSSTWTSVEETSQPRTQRSFQGQDTNDHSTQASFQDQDNQTFFKEQDTNNPPSTQSSSNETDANKPSTRTSIQARGSTPGGEDTLVNSGSGYHGLPVVLGACVAVLLGCLVWLVSSWRAKRRRRMECDRTSRRRETTRLIKYDLVTEGEN
ncbi:uncharacterized protein LOC127597621 isoform X2 [Hippocampus zosterae]|uniref:uncharacterized protein LOC127597621 isoform X2 n=1 Tax=Hippocampus zosterae TaxID=109293 RepID=UPI00223D8FFD|nr:uncharacterized protein LOC127597621 isoform X2 [Hippocampus zosterae]